MKWSFPYWRLLREKAEQVRGRLLRRFLGEKMACGDRETTEIVGPSAPDLHWVVPGSHRTGGTPERQYGATDPALTAISFVVLEIQRRGRAGILHK